MFEQHFGLRENPFPAGHQLKFVYPSREHQEARAHLRYGIENREPFLLITGEVGTGKTTSLYDALNEWGDRVAVALITNSALSRQEMLEEICLRFGMELQPGISKPAALVMLEKHLITVRSRGEHAVLMMDEAQNLSMDLLEEIRLLSNLEHKGDKLLQIFLVGQPELEAHLARHELRQLRQRITVHYRLNPLSPEETVGYIHHHINVAGGNGALVFPTDTCREIFRLSHGIPREINTLSSSALIAAYADGSPSVTLTHLAAASHEGDFRSVLSGPSARPPEPEPTPPPPPPMAAAPQRPSLAPPPSQQPQQPMPPQVMRRPAEPPQSPVWPPLPQPVASTRPMAPPPPPQPPAPPMPPADPYAAPRERGEISRGLMAAMRRAETPPPAPPQPPAPPVRPSQFMVAPRAQFAPPQQQSMAPPPPPPPAPIPFPRANVAPQYPQQPQPQGMSNLPPRLRERLERDLSRTERPPSTLRNGLIAISVVATLGIMLVLMQRFGAIDVPFLRGVAGSRAASPPSGEAGDGNQGSALEPTTQDPTAALIDSLKREVESAKRSASVHTASTPNNVSEPTRRVVEPPVQEPVHTDTPVPPVRSSSSQQRSEPVAETPSDAATNDAANGSHYGVGVAAFLDADRARTEKDRLSRDTTLPGQVVPYQEAGTTMYRVVLGRWTSQEDAEKAANALMERGLINESRVVAIPRH
jgi:type II secretory pathway predicted ATPase ExeA